MTDVRNPSPAETNPADRERQRRGSGRRTAYVEAQKRHPGRLRRLLGGARQGNGKGPGSPVGPDDDGASPDVAVVEPDDVASTEFEGSTPDADRDSTLDLAELSPPEPDRERPAGREPPQRQVASRRRTRHVARQRSPRHWSALSRLSMTFGVLSLLAAGIIALLTVTADTTPDTDDAEVAVPAEVADQTVVLLLRTAPGTNGAAGLTLLASGEDGRASATFIPTTTLVEIPGVGLDRIGLATQYGGSDLTAATLENATGIELDGAITIDQADLGELLQRAGGAQVDVTERLVSRAVDGTGTVAFEPGEQFLNGIRLAEYWAFDERGESELDTFPRQQRALEAMLSAFGDDQLLDEMFADVPDEFDTTLDAETLRSLFRGTGSAATEGDLIVQLLPVEPFGSSDQAQGGSYQIVEDEVVELVQTQFAGAVAEGGRSGQVTMQILNGVGVPGIGQQVDERLRGLGLRIVRTENARTFDFTETQIVIYDDDPELMAAAREVQAALGVGTILLSRQPQSVVDLTVVVGGDFTAEPNTTAPGF